MGGRVASRLIVLHLFLFMFAEALAEVGEKSKQVEMNGEMEDGVIKMVTKMADNSQQVNSIADSSSSHMEHMNRPERNVFFTINDLKLGKKMPFYLPPLEDPSTAPPMVSKQIADSIPFSLKQLPEILQYFSFSPGSPQSQAVENTLRQCEIKPIKGETKFCATSMESMTDFARLVLGLDSKSSFKHLKTIHLKESRPPYLQNYTLLQMPHEIGAPKFLPCHFLIYPYAVHLCHLQEGDNRVMQIPLKGENGNLVLAAAVCHMDTSEWDPNHVSFRLLKTKPGTIPICHFFPPSHFIMIPTST